MRGRVVLLLGIAAFCLSVAPSLLAQDYCSLKVRVAAPHGKPFPVFVTVYEKSGRKIEREQAPPDDLRFCDLGILPVKVVVGTKGCHEVVINEVRNYWREPYTLTVTYDPEHCMRELPPPPKPVCEMLFRVSGFNGGWINKASMKFEKPLQSLQTDSEGRALLITVLDNDIKGTASAPGYIPKTFSISCAEPGEHEKIVKLAKR